MALGMYVEMCLAVPEFFPVLSPDPLGHTTKKKPDKNWWFATGLFRGRGMYTVQGGSFGFRAAKSRSSTLPCTVWPYCTLGSVPLASVHAYNVRIPTHRLDRERDPLTRKFGRSGYGPKE